MTAAARRCSQNETIAALKIIDRGDLTPTEMVGSWAGELGQTQFLPTHYFNYAVDYDGDGHRNLLRSAADVIGSTANYIANGLKWRRGEPWLQEVRVPQNLPWDQADLTIKHPRSKWAQLGVTYPDGKPLPNDDLPASLLLPMGRIGPAFLAYANFAAYTEWNNSLIYSTTAGYLATRIAGAAPMRQPAAPVAQLPFNEIKELQQLLVRAGFNVGKVDGVLGQQSRTAVKAMQVKYGLPADSWPTAELLARMRGVRHARTAACALPAALTSHGLSGSRIFNWIGGLQELYFTCAPPHFEHARTLHRQYSTTRKEHHMSFYDATVPAFLQILGSLSGILSKAEAHCKAKNIQPDVLLGARLYPDMLPLTRQIQLACDFAAKGCARLTAQRSAVDARHRKEL